MRRRSDWAAVADERSTLADLLEGLADSEWAVHSLCPGWRVRDVAAHLTAPAAAPTPALDARSKAHLVADLRRPRPQRLLHRGGSPRDALVEVLVHGQDIARPLGRERPMDPARAAVAARRVWSARPFRASRRYPGIRFEATDTELVLGDGTPVNGPAAAVLLTLTGRAAGLDDLSGHGIGLLQRAFSRPR